MYWKNQSPNRWILGLQDSGYPKQLKEINYPPPILFVEGDISLLSQAQIAIIGSRKPSPLGLKISQNLTQELIQAGLIVTSGLALGIDASAHRAALDCGSQTIAVLGTGINRMYPNQNQFLGEEIKHQGALISEFPLHYPPKAKNFPIRNRIVSGLSLGVLVIEASERSGSLITARLACEQGREVFAIPGSPLNLNARGCNLLIQQGAKLVAQVKDIIEELELFFRKNSDEYIKKDLNQKSNFMSEQEYEAILSHISYETTSINDLVTKTQLTVQKISYILNHLILKDFIAQVPGGYVKIN